MNITFSDLIVIVTNIPLSVVSTWYNEWAFGTAGCNFYATCNLDLYFCNNIYNFLRFSKQGGSLFGFLNISIMTFRALEKSIVIKKPFSALKKDKRFTLSNHDLNFLTIIFHSFLIFKFS